DTRTVVRELWMGCTQGGFEEPVRISNQDPWHGDLQFVIKSNYGLCSKRRRVVWTRIGRGIQGTKRKGQVIHDALDYRSICPVAASRDVLDPKGQCISESQGESI